MSRPHRCRWISQLPDKVIFEPQTPSRRARGYIELTLDELEAMRQAHHFGRTQEEGAAEMGISRSTFGRVLENAHQKVTEALLEQKILTISGGPVIMNKRQFECRDCGHTWEESFGTGRPTGCPDCLSINFTRTDAGQRGRGACKHGPQGGQGYGGGKQGQDSQTNVKKTESQ